MRVSPDDFRADSVDIVGFSGGGECAKCVEGIPAFGTTRPIVQKF